MDDFEGERRSSELPLFDRPYITSYYYHSILRRFLDITTFTVYVTGCHLEKSFVFAKDR